MQTDTVAPPAGGLATQLPGLIKGEILTDAATLATYSHDASLFEVRPQAVACPQGAADVQALIKFVSERKATDPSLSLTARSAGTDMSGGAINDGLIVDFSRHFTRIEAVTPTTAQVQPGVFYRDFEAATLAQGSLMPSYPASRQLCTIGGMVNTNAGGEKSLRYGKTENFVTALQVVLSDGNLYTLKPLTKTELETKMAQSDFEGQLYKGLYDLIESHYDQIQAAKPHVSKNSTGYNLWDVWDRTTFDLTKLFVGAQGTLGFVTDIHLRLVPAEPHSGLLVVFMKDIDRLGELITAVLPHQPASFESFDDHTLYLSLKFLPSFIKTLGWRKWLKLLVSLIPDGLLLLRGLPKLILMIEFSGQTPAEVEQKIETMRTALKPFKLPMERDETEAKSQKFWIMRRESFNLLRQKVKDKHTAPFIDDLVVPPERLVEFLPQLRAIIKKYQLLATIAGHMGDGNFHIIPLMKLEDPAERAKLLPAMTAVNQLVLSYGGSLSGEHNDGLVRGPWLEQMYGPEVLGLFRQVKQLFDPQNIFNPHKKATADWDWSFSHVRASFN